MVMVVVVGTAGHVHVVVDAFASLGASKAGVNSRSSRVPRVRHFRSPCRFVSHADAALAKSSRMVEPIRSGSSSHGM
jgi:hypothetical protein